MIVLIDKSRTLSEFEKNNLSDYANQALEFNKRESEDVTIVISDDTNLQSLNKEFSGNNYPTDVLSFIANQNDPETGNIYLGDIVISIDRATVQSKENGITLQKELTMLIVHGILHLCGYDHADKDSQTRMFSIQSSIINNLKDF